MNIAIAGKGGSGKTTIAGILARSLGRQRGGALALDGDSNPNLALTLGLSQEEIERMPSLGPDLLEQYTDSEGKKRMRLAAAVSDVVSRFGIPAPDHVRLLVINRVGHSGAG